MKHIFDVSFATKYGVAEAVLAENILFWAKRNAANGVHYHDGLYWTYNSRKAFAQLFPYISSSSIERALNHLVDAGILAKGNYNKDKMNRTSWYAMTEKGESELSETVDFPDFIKNGVCIDQYDQCTASNRSMYIDNNTDIKQTDIKPKRKKESTTSSYESILSESGLDETVIPVVWDFIKMRKFIKAPMTDKALVLMINNLKKMDRSPEGQIEILNQSITNSWKGIFPVEQEKRKSNGRNDVAFAIIDSWGDEK